MKNIKPAELNSAQQEQLTNVIVQQACGKTEMVAHEIVSEYVHTDTMILSGEGMYFASFGMSAAAQPAPIPAFERVELILTTEEVMTLPCDEARMLCAELCRISKYPFREHSWLGTGHTMDMSEAFRERYGYAYFIFLGPVFTAEVDGVGCVSYLQLIPIYEEEREWIVAHDTFAYLEAYFDTFGKWHLDVDVPRERFIPED